MGFEAGRLLRAAAIDPELFTEAVRARNTVGPDLFDYMRLATQSSESERAALERMARYATKDLPAVIALAAELGVALPRAQQHLEAFEATARPPDTAGTA